MISHYMDSFSINLYEYEKNDCHYLESFSINLKENGEVYVINAKQ